MCGIYGVITFDKNYKVPVLERIFKTLEANNSRRGPDSSGQFVWDTKHLKALLGHSRLAITGIGQSTFQPVIIKEEGQEAVVLFNGEIYNAKELADKYNIEFDENITSDTKIAALLFENRSEFDGMFSLVKLDLRTKTLTLARDWIGIKPLYWAQLEGVIIFSSFLKAILECRVTLLKQNSKSIEEFKNLGFNNRQDAFFDNVYQVSPGQTIVITKETTIDKKQNLNTFATTDRTNQYSCEKLENLFLTNLELTIPKQTNFTVALSSGLDSSLIATGCQKLGYKPKTITLDFLGSKECASEGTAAQKLSNHLGLQNITVQVTPEKIRSELNKIIQAMDYPSQDGINTYFLAQEACKHAKVILSGLGADELFFGYRSTIQAYSNLNASLFIKTIKGLAAKLLPHSLNYRLNIDFWPKFETGDQASQAVVKTRNSGQFNRVLLENFTKNTRELPLTLQLILSELFLYTEPILLRDSDWASMNFGLELRVPFLNKNFASKIMAWQVGQKTPSLNKSWLWTLARTWGLDKFIAPRKLGFVPPLQKALDREFINLQTSKIVWTERKHFFLDKWLEQFKCKNVNLNGSLKNIGNQEL